MGEHARVGPFAATTMSTIENKPCHCSHLKLWSTGICGIHKHIIGLSLLCCRVRMRGILEKYRYIIYFKWYDIIILLNSVFHTQQLQNTPIGSASQIVAQWLNVTTEQCDGSNRWNRRSEIWHYFGYKTDDKGELTDLTAPVCKPCYRPKSCCHRNTLNLFKHLMC